MEVGQQARAARDVGARDGLALVAQVRAQLRDLRIGDARGELAHQGGLDHRAHLEHLARLVDAGHRDEGAARRLERDQAVAAELVQRLAHQRARHLEDVGDLLLGQLGAGRQPALDDRRGDRLDDALRGARRHMLKRLGAARSARAAAGRGSMTWRPARLRGMVG